MREGRGDALTVHVRIPAPLRRFAGDTGVVDLEATDVGDAVRQLEGVRERVLDERGALRRHVNVFVNGESVKFLDGLATALKDGDEVAIIPAVSGGSDALTRSSRVYLGQVLVDRGLIDTTQLDSALEEQTRTNVSLGRILTERGLVTKDDVLSAIAAVSGWPFIDFDERPPDPAAIALIPERDARSLGVIAVEARPDRVLVAMADPTDPQTIDAVRKLTGLPVWPAMAAREAIDAAIDRFYSYARPAAEPNGSAPSRLGRDPADRPPWEGRVLATVMFTDLVSSSERTAAMGDRSWREVLAQHNSVVRELISEFGGREINTWGDSFVVTFDLPARAIHCAVAVRDAVTAIGLDVRCGIHTGEVELMDANIVGHAVNLGSRVADLAEAGEILVSGTVRELVSGGGHRFTSRGAHEFKGIPEPCSVWALDA